VEVALLSESFVLLHDWPTRGVSRPWHFLAGIPINVSEFEPERLFMLSGGCPESPDSICGALR
jgi:hypothetical protein